MISIPQNHFVMPPAAQRKRWLPAASANAPPWQARSQDYEEEQRIHDTAAAREEVKRFQARNRVTLPTQLRWSLEDLATVAGILGAAALLSPASVLRRGWGAHGEGSGGHGHEIDELSHSRQEEERGAHGGGGGVSGRGFDMQVTLCVASVLVGVTILFEKAKHALEASAPRGLAVVLQALFGEFTVLGFIVPYLTLPHLTLPHLTLPYLTLQLYLTLPYLLQVSSPS